LRIDLHGGRRASHQAHAIRHLIDVDAHRHALRKAHPGEDRIYRGESAVCSVNQQSADLAGVRERAIGPTRAAVAAVRRRDSSRERFAAATWSTLETGAPVLADCAAAFDCRIIDVANVARMTSRFARGGAAEVGLCGQLDLFCRDYHIVRACPA